MKLKHHRMWKVMLVAGVVLLVALSGFSFWLTKQQTIAREKALIGVMYEKSPKAGEMLVNEWFRITGSLEEQEKGEEALIQLGYTSEGAEYLYHEGSLPKLQNAIWGMQLILLGIIIYSLYCLNQQKQYMKKRLNEIEDLKKELRAKEQELASMSQNMQAFVENIAHQIKTPMSCVSVSLDMLQETLREETQKEYVSQGFVYLKEIEVLLKRLLDIGRLESGKAMMRKEALHVEQLLKECAALLSPDGQNRFVITAEREEDVQAEYYGDYEWLKEAFSNIMKNCIEHDKSGKAVEVRLVQRKEHVFILIRDHGPGIEKEDLAHIFDRFYLPDNAKKTHTGIGLNLAALVVKKHFGTIEALNYEDGGAMFSIVLPNYGLKNEKLSFS